VIANRLTHAAVTMEVRLPTVATVVGTVGEMDVDIRD
jgi:hypothetical protein